MRCLTQIAIAAFALWFSATLHVKNRPSVLQKDFSSQADQDCPANPGRDQQTNTARTSVADLTISGAEGVPVPDLSEIATWIKQSTHGISQEAAFDEALEKATRAWQDRGYFNVHVTGDSKLLTSNAVNQRIAISIQVVEGLQYRLGQIKFKHNKAITNLDRLRGLFSTRDGDVFSRQQIATGLENLRKAYGELGYANFTPVPNTTFDDANKTISIVIDIDEGRQFYIGSIRILGLDEVAQRELLRDSVIQVGQVYNRRLLELFQQQHLSILTDCRCRLSEQMRLDEKRGIVALTFDTRPCSDE